MQREPWPLHSSWASSGGRTSSQARATSESGDRITAAGSVRVTEASFPLTSQSRLSCHYAGNANFDRHLGLNRLFWAVEASSIQSSGAIYTSCNWGGTYEQTAPVPSDSRCRWPQLHPDSLFLTTVTFVRGSLKVSLPYLPAASREGPGPCHPQLPHLSMVPTTKIHGLQSQADTSTASNLTAV